MKETERYSGIGTLVRCISSNNGEPLLPWKRWFKDKSSFKFQRGGLYTAVFDKGKIFVIQRDHVPVEFERDYFNSLFRIVGGK